MSANIAWGPAVSVDGKPDWVNPHDLIRWSNNGRPYREVVAGQVRQWGDHDNRITIRLGCDHPHYAQSVPAPDGVTPRDTVARIIDPYVWEDGDDTHGAYMARSIALEKADEIIVALATTPARNTSQIGEG